MVLKGLKRLGMVEHGGMLFMLKDKLYIHDRMFSHANSSSWYNIPEKFDWVRKYDENHLIFTDFSLQYVDQFNNQKKIAWLLESPSITKSAYEFIKQNHNKFDKIFTFDKELLNISNKFIMLPIGGCWINETDRIIHEKTKNISMIASNKRSTTGHILRHEIIDSFKNFDLYGTTNPIEKKITGLRDYRFSIVVENCKSDYYFTEKLIDCFVTGTIPIYWGCPSIFYFFNDEGILSFNSLDELENILNNATEEFYLSKLDAIKENFELSFKYLIADNEIYKQLKKNESN
jgi:hypothetical protein